MHIKLVVLHYFEVEALLLINSGVCVILIIKEKTSLDR